MTTIIGTGEVGALHSREELEEMQRLPLQRKIQITTARIIEWYQHYDGKVYVAFSGGKDSTVLLDIVRRIYPDVPAVFSDTGLEFPEVREFVKSCENVTIVRPEMNFRKVIEVYGYPVVSKRVANTVEYGHMVFYKSPPPYHPQMTVGEKNHTKGKAVGKQAEDVHSNRSYGNYTLVESPDGNMKYPASIWRFPKPHPSVALHATEKPVDLLRYAIRTYTDRNAIVLDNCCGTGSTLIAAKLEGRRYIGIDNGVCDKKKSPYYGMPWAQVAQIRLEAIDHEPADEPERHQPLGEGTTEGVCTPSGVSA